MILLKKVLVATDFSDVSNTALAYGRALARSFDATMTVLHITDVVATGIGEAGGKYDDVQRAAEEAARAQVETQLTAEDRSVLHAKAVTLASIEPAESIVTYAAQETVDVIVMGTHGRGGMAHLLMGSVAEGVVRSAPCPVLVVKHPEREFVLPDLPRA